MYWLVKVLTAWGKSTLKKQDEAEDTYVPLEEGRWVNKAKRPYQENWVWESNIVQLKSYWVNVFKQGPNNYLILVAEEGSEFAIECVDCDNLREVNRAIAIYESYYNHFGKVNIDNQYAEEA